LWGSGRGGGLEACPTPAGAVAFWLAGEAGYEADVGDGGVVEPLAGYDGDDGEAEAFDGLVVAGDVDGLGPVYAAELMDDGVFAIEVELDFPRAAVLVEEEEGFAEAGADFGGVEGKWFRDFDVEVFALARAVGALDPGGSGRRAESRCFCG